MRELLGAFAGPNYSKERIKTAMQHSTNFGIYELVDGNLIIVGFARVVSDHSLFSTLIDVVITEPKRRKGLGSQLVSEILNHVSFRSTTWIIHTPSAGVRSFYEKLGFKIHKDGIMVRGGSA